jgi:hypothetical protein
VIKRAEEIKKSPAMAYFGCVASRCESTITAEMEAASFLDPQQRTNGLLDFPSFFTGTMGKYPPGAPLAGGIKQFPPHSMPISKEMNMNITLSLAPLVSLIAGILILVAPRLLNYIVAIYLISIGLLGLFGASSFHIR